MDTIDFPPDLKYLAFNVLVEKHFRNGNQDTMKKDLDLLKNLNSPYMDMLINAVESRSWQDGKLLWVKTPQTDELAEHMLDRMYMNLIQPLDIPRYANVPGTMADEIERLATNISYQHRWYRLEWYKQLAEIHHPKTWKIEIAELLDIIIHL
jgi:hypothetical protein